MVEKKTILITGVRRGIGKAIYEELGQDPALRVLGTMRKGNDGLPGLELASPESVETFLASPALPPSLQVVIQNAAVSGARSPEEVDRLFQINVFSPIQIFHGLRSRMPRGAKMILISSGMGELASINLEDRNFLEREDLPEAEIREWAKNRIHASASFHPYSLSKAVLNALVRSWNREYGDGLCITSVCPGWVRTDMGGAGAPRSVEKGAETPVLLAKGQADHCGEFIRDMESIPW